MNKKSNLQEEINELKQELKNQKKRSKNTQVITILVVFVMTLVLNNLNISAENSYTSEEVSYDNTNSSGLTSPNVQGALDGLYQAATDYNDIKTNKADKTATVSTVGWDSTNKKLTKTINGTTSDVVTGATILGGLTSSQVTTALGYTPPTADTNTWRGIQNNLTSTSTTDSLSAYQGNLLNTRVNNLESRWKNNGTLLQIGGSDTSYWKELTLVHNNVQRGAFFYHPSDNTIRILSNNSSGGWGEGALDIYAKPIKINSNQGGLGDLILNGNVKISGSVKFGGTSFQGMFVVEWKASSAQTTISANGDTTIYISGITKSGYTPLVATECRAYNGTGGNGSSYALAYYTELQTSNNRIQINVKNLYTGGSIKIMTGCRVLYVKNY